MITRLFQLTLYREPGEVQPPERAEGYLPWHPTATTPADYIAPRQVTSFMGHGVVPGADAGVWILWIADIDYEAMLLQQKEDYEKKLREENNRWYKLHGEFCKKNEVLFRVTKILLQWMDSADSSLKSGISSTPHHQAEDRPTDLMRSQLAEIVGEQELNEFMEMRRQEAETKAEEES